MGAPFSLHSAAVNELELDPPLATGATVGYARVSTAGQLLDRQLASLTAAGCIRKNPGGDEVTLKITSQPDERLATRITTLMDAFSS